MPRTLSYQQAINEALDQEMARDERVLVIGEDVAGGHGADGEMDAWGGPLGVTKGLYTKYGDRVLDTPISESAFVGAGIGAAQVVYARCAAADFEVVIAGGLRIEATDLLFEYGHQDAFHGLASLWFVARRAIA